MVVVQNLMKLQGGYKMLLQEEDTIEGFIFV